MFDEEIVIEAGEESALPFPCSLAIALAAISSIFGLCRNLFKPLVHFARVSLVKTW